MSRTPSSFEKAPTEIISGIASHLNHPDLSRLARTCRTLSAVANSLLYDDIRLKDVSHTLRFASSADTAAAKGLTIHDEAIPRGRDEGFEEAFHGMLESMTKLERIRIEAFWTVNTSWQGLLAFTKPVPHVSMTLGSTITTRPGFACPKPSPDYERQTARWLINACAFEPDILGHVSEHIKSLTGKTKELIIGLRTVREMLVSFGTIDGLPRRQTLVNGLATLTCGVSAKITQLYLPGVLGLSDHENWADLRDSTFFAGCDMRTRFTYQVTGSLETEIRDRIKEIDPNFKGSLVFNKGTDAFFSNSNPEDFAMSDDEFSLMKDRVSDAQVDAMKKSSECGLVDSNWTILSKGSVRWDADNDQWVVDRVLE